MLYKNYIKKKMIEGQLDCGGHLLKSNGVCTKVDSNLSILCSGAQGYIST